MFTWFKTKVVAPIVGFFKSLFGYKQLEERAIRAEKALERANKTIAELNSLYDNLSQGNNELIRNYNRDVVKLREENHGLKANLKDFFTDMKTQVKSIEQEVARNTAMISDAEKEIRTLRPN